LAWVAGYVMRQFTCPKAVTHPSTNRARCRATALIETNAVPLHQTANHVPLTHWIYASFFMRIERLSTLFNCLNQVTYFGQVGLILTSMFIV